MTAPVRIKICGVTRRPKMPCWPPSKLGADLIGVNFYPPGSKREVEHRSERLGRSAKHSRCAGRRTPGGRLSSIGRQWDDIDRDPAIASPFERFCSSMATETEEELEADRRCATIKAIRGAVPGSVAGHLSRSTILTASTILHRGWRPGPTSTAALERGWSYERLIARRVRSDGDASRGDMTAGERRRRGWLDVGDIPARGALDVCDGCRGRRRVRKDPRLLDARCSSEGRIADVAKKIGRGVPSESGESS